MSLTYEYEYDILVYTVVNRNTAPSQSLVVMNEYLVEVLHVHVRHVVDCRSVRVLVFA